MSDNKDDKKKSYLKEALLTAANTKAYYDRLDALEKRIKEQSEKSEAEFGKKLNSQKGETKKALHALHEEVRANQKDVNLHMTNVATLILQGAPRFRVLMNLIKSRRKEVSLMIDHALGFDVHGGVVSNWMRKKGIEISHKFSKDKEIDIPDLKYFADVTEDGFFEMYWIEDTFAGLFLDENKKFSSKDSENVQNYLEDGIEKWLESKGYCIVSDAANPKKFRLYNKADVDTLNNKSTPKAGLEQNYLTENAYKNLRDTSPGSLGEYLRMHFYDVSVELEPDTTRQPRP